MVRAQFDSYKLIGIPLTVLLLIISVLLMGAIRDVREKELRISLQNVDQGKAGKSMGLIARYKLIRKRYSAAKEKASDYLAEGELMAVLSSEFSAAKPLQFELFEKPALVIVNLVGALVGAAPVTNLSEDRGHKILETAYFYERKRQFQKAVQVYGVAEEFFDSDVEATGYIRLHKGFCLSLIGERKKALAYYSQVSEELPHTEMGLTADALASFLRDVENRLAKVDTMKLSVKKGENYYRLMAYNLAISTLDKAEKKKKSQKLYFYRGRSFEEIGRTKEAIRDYRKTISLNPRSLYAKNANRRLYLLGAFYEGDKALQNESKKNAIKLGDKKFIEKSEKLVAATDTERVAKLSDDEVTKSTVSFIEEEIADLKAEDKNSIPVQEKKKETEKVVVEPPKKKANPKKTVKPKKEKKPKKVEAKLPKKRLTDPSLSRTQRKQLLIKKYKKVDKIFTQDGNVFVGAVIKENSNKITIVTVFGVIRVPQEKVSMRLKVNSKSALK